MNTKTKLFLLGPLIYFCFTCNTLSTESLKISNLRCEYLINPLGIDITEPRLSWILESDKRGQKQTGYQILVASSKENLEQDKGDLWDSGKVESDKSIHVIYKGKLLLSQMQCFWKVRIWDKDGKAADWSEMATWSMGLLKNEDWKAKWIGLDKDDAEQKDKKSTEDLIKSEWIWYPEGNPASSAPPETRYFRLNLNIPKNKKVKMTNFLFTADNEFILWVNGKEVGSGNDWDLLYEFDLLKNLKTGKNTIAVEAKNIGDKNNPAGIIGCLRIDYIDGQSLIIHTNREWLVSETKNTGWELTEFDDSKWMKAKTLGRYGNTPWGISRNSDETMRLTARYLRHEFLVDKKVKRAVAYVCGLGLFELHLNGQKIGNHVLEPGLTEYTKQAFYVTFDVTEYLKQGANALGVILGNGRYYAPRLRVPTYTQTFGYPKLILQMQIDYEDNSNQLIVSDENWKITTKGPIISNSEYDGEEYDAQLEMPDWDQTGFDESKWEKVELVNEPGGVLKSQMIEPIRVTQIIKPIAITNPKPDMYVFDMGQNMVGWCRLKIKGSKGTKIMLRHAEVLEDNGVLYMANIRSAKATDIYTLKGNGTEVYEPRFTYHGFRYVEVTGFPGEPTLANIQGCVVHDDVEPAGSFYSSNPLLNQIRKNIEWGVRGNYRSLPTDCPQRDERQGWLGDRAAESKGETYLFNIARLYGKWMADINDSQLPTGSVPSVSPSYWPLFPNDVTWPSCYIIVPNTLYEQYGDVYVIKERYPSMKKWIDFMSGYLENGIMPRDTYGDWCVPPESPELIHSRDPKRSTAKAVLGTAYFYHNLRLMAHYANILGKSTDENEFNTLAETIKEKFNKKFFKEDSNQYDNGSQTSFVLPLYFGMVPEKQNQQVFNNLVEKILSESKGHIGTGLIGAQWLMRVLSDNGRPDIAYMIATQKTYPSWGYMIEKGATTIWELWNGNTADPAMNSGNHVMLIGDLNIWFNEYLAGIKTDSEQPAFKRIIMRPHPVSDLTFVKTTYKSMHGTIISDWKIEDGNFKWNIKIPANTSAKVYIPAKNAEDVTEGGKSIAQTEGVKFMFMEGNTAVFNVESGSYNFVSKKF